MVWSPVLPSPVGSSSPRVVLCSPPLSGVDGQTDGQRQTQVPLGAECQRARSKTEYRGVSGGDREGGSMSHRHGDDPWNTVLQARRPRNEHCIKPGVAHVWFMKGKRRGTRNRSIGPTTSYAHVTTGGSDCGPLVESKGSSGSRLDVVAHLADLEQRKPWPGAHTWPDGSCNGEGPVLVPPASFSRPARF